MPNQYFPINVRNFTPKVNLQDTVNADDINALQTEVYNIEYYLNGTTNAQDGMLTSNWSGSFIQQVAPWNSLDDRISNIEAGLVNGAGVSPYFKKAGDAITVSNVVAITVKNVTASNGTNLVEVYDNSNNLGFNLDGNGLPQVGNNAVVYVNSSAYNNIQTAITAAGNAASSNPFNPFLLAGM